MNLREGDPIQYYLFDIRVRDKSYRQSPCPVSSTNGSAGELRTWPQILGRVVWRATYRWGEVEYLVRHRDIDIGRAQCDECHLNERP